MARLRETGGIASTVSFNVESLTRRSCPAVEYSALGRRQRRIVNDLLQLKQIAKAHFYGEQP